MVPQELFFTVVLYEGIVFYPVWANLQFAHSEYKNLQFGSNKQKVKG